MCDCKPMGFPRETNQSKIEAEFTHADGLTNGGGLEGGVAWGGNMLTAVAAALQLKGHDRHLNSIRWYRHDGIIHAEQSGADAGSGRVRSCRHYRQSRYAGTLLPLQSISYQQRAAPGGHRVRLASVSALPPPPRRQPLHRRQLTVHSRRRPVAGGPCAQQFGFQGLGALYKVRLCSCMQRPAAADRQLSHALLCRHGGYCHCSLCLATRSNEEPLARLNPCRKPAMQLAE